MRVSFEWADEDDEFPENHYKVSFARDDHFINRKEAIGKLMANVIRTMELENDPRGDTIFLRVVDDGEAEVLSEMLDSMRADEWKD